MLWVLCGCHLVDLPCNTVSANQQWCKKGRLIMCPLLLHLVWLLVRADIIPHWENEKIKCPEAQLKSRVSLNFPIPLPILENVLWSKIRLLLLLWHLSLLVEKLGEVGEIRKAAPVFQKGCHNWDCSVWTSVNCCMSLYPCIMQLYFHQ